MAQDLESILVGQTGKIYNAPLGTTAPTTPTAAWGVGWVDLGTISEDGLTMSFNEDTAEVRQWGGGVVRKLFTASETTFQFVCLESNAEVMARYYHSPITAGAVEIKGGVRDERMWGFDVLDGDTHVRYVVERGELTGKGDVVHKADEAVSYDFTVTGYQNDELVSAIMYSDLASWEAA